MFGGVGLGFNSHPPTELLKQRSDARAEDGLCDSCRFVLILHGVMEERAVAPK